MAEVKNERNAKGSRVSVEFVDGNGLSAKRPMEGVKSLKVKSVSTGIEVEIVLRDLTADVAMRLLAQGASVLLRNTINTNENEDEAAEDLMALADAWKGGSYYPDGTRTCGIPLIIRAMERALLAAGKDAAFVQEKVQTYYAAWVEFPEDKKAQGKNRYAISKKLAAAPAIKQAALDIAAESARKAKPVVEVELDAI